MTHPRRPLHEQCGQYPAQPQQAGGEVNQRTWEPTRLIGQGPMSEHKQVGNATITVQDDEFINGYQTGYLRYIADYRGKPLTDMGVYAFMVRIIIDVLHSGRWNAGYIIGWVAALHERRKVSTEAASPIAWQEVPEQ